MNKKSCFILSQKNDEQNRMRLLLGIEQNEKNRTYQPIDSKIEQNEVVIRNRIE